ETSLGRRRFGVRTEADPRLADLLADIVVGHQEVDRLDAAAVLDDQIDGRIFRRDAAHARHFGERLAGERFESLALEADEQHALRRTGEAHQVLPRHIRVAHLLQYA